MNKTLYLKDDDGPLWDRARELSGDKLSPVILEALKKYVAEKEKTAEGFQRIVVNYADTASDSIFKSKAFQGKWLIRPDENFQITKSHIPFQISVAVTPKGNFVLLRYHVDVASNEVTKNGRFDVLESVEEIANLAYGYGELARIVQERYGIVPVEELDI